MATTDITASTLPTANGGTSALQWFTSWVAILLIVGLLARTSWGRPAVYYLTWMTVLILVLTHAGEFAAIINPAQSGN